MNTELVDGTTVMHPTDGFVPVGDSVSTVLENRGVEPDIEVEFPPHDHAAGRDPQLARAVEEARRLVRERGGVVYA